MRRTISCFLGIAFGAFVVMASSPIHAQRIGDIRGAGTVECGTFLEHRRVDANKQIYTEWAYGFLSSYNLWSSQPQLTRLPDDGTIDAYFQKYCRENPLNGIAAATLALVGDLGGFKPATLKK